MSNFYFLRKLDIYLGRVCNLLIRQKYCSNKIFCRKILLIKLWGLGNLTIIWPLVYKIKEKYPDAVIYFLTFDLNRGFLERNQAINRIFYFKYTKNIFKIAVQFAALIRYFKKEKIDIAVNFETFNNASAFFSYLMRAVDRVGIHNKYEKIFYNHWANRNQNVHISQTFSSLLKPLGIDSPYSYFNFSESKKDRYKMERVLGNLATKQFVCMHAGTSDNFYRKRYSKRSFAELANLLICNSDAHIIFTGTPKERALAEDIIEEILPKDRVRNLAGDLTIWEFIELLRQSVLFISNDTGPVHLAASLGIASAVFYGPTMPHMYEPLTENCLIFYKKTACSPCVGINYITKDCINKYKCLDFSPQEVFDRICEKFFNKGSFEPSAMNQA
ncbi:MAG: glycosyltransferase family 9 protein [Candidatus Omnitrophica bacterium]|nr:glycosyltransferase family 9 protein [Candidatus Omnitrophota bacterium]